MCGVLPSGSMASGNHLHERSAMADIPVPVTKTVVTSAWGAEVANACNASAQLVGYALGAGTDQVLATPSPVEIIGLSVTWSADPAHAYLLFMSMNLQGGTPGPVNAAMGFLNGGAVVNQHSVTNVAASQMVSVSQQWIETGQSGSQTRKVFAQHGAGGNLTAVGTYSRRALFYVMDLGKWPRV